MALDAKLKTWQAALLKALQDSDGSEAAVNAVVTSALTDLESITDDLNAFSNLEPYAAAVRAFSTEPQQSSQARRPGNDPHL